LGHTLKLLDNLKQKIFFFNYFALIAREIALFPHFWWTLFYTLALALLGVVKSSWEQRQKIRNFA
jgi:hypothetical protein